MDEKIDFKLESEDYELISRFISEDMKMQKERILNENKVLKNEISQLREERNFLFEQLKESPACRSLEISPAAAFEACEAERRLVDKATQTIERKYEFSKEKFLNCLANYHNTTFTNIYNFLKESKSGDAMVTYVINSTGNIINELEKEILELRIQVIKEQNKRRKEKRQAMESLTDSMSEKLKLRCELIDEKHKNDDI